MKRLKHDFKKGMAFVLSLAMVAGLVPAMSIMVQLSRQKSEIFIMN